jgi:cob(I)alamin adenosyltransferase
MGDTAMGIATKRGDGGQTSLAGGIRISKAALRVEAEIVSLTREKIASFRTHHVIRS